MASHNLMDAVRPYLNNPHVKAHLKKFIVPIVFGLAFLVTVMICVGPSYYTGGSISNAHLTKNVGLDMNLSGYSWGSRSMIAREGQTIEVEIDVHEITHGELYVRLSCNGMINRDEWKSLRIKTVGRHTIRLVASQRANYVLKFEPCGERNNTYDYVSGGVCDLKYSATWDVL